MALPDSTVSACVGRFYPYMLTMQWNPVGSGRAILELILTFLRAGRDSSCQLVI